MHMREETRVVLTERGGGVNENNRAICESESEEGMALKCAETAKERGLKRQILCLFDKVTL